MMQTCWLVSLLLLPPSLLAARPGRRVETRQGPLQGILLAPDYPGLGTVEAFLGVPYAAPPVGGLRFMPPGAPKSWPASQVRQATQFGPVCPQLLPDLSDEENSLRFLSPGRLAYLRRLFTYLAPNQSEDCLHLNIYSPAASPARSRYRRLPVIVFIHGESYEATFNYQIDRIFKKQICIKVNNALLSI